VPLAIVWSIGLIGLGSSVESVLHRLGSGQSDIARFCFEESVKHIRGRDAHKLLMALALFAVDASREAVGVVAELGDDEFGRDIGLEELLRLSLINKEGERLSLLPLTRSFVQAEIAQQSVSVEQAERRLWEYYAQFVRQLKGFWRDWGKYDQFERDLANCFRIIDALAASILYTENELGERMIAPDSRGRAEQLTEMIDIMARVCRLRGYWSEYERISYIAIPLSHQLNQIAMVGWRYRDLGRINYVRGDTGLAKKLALEALSIAKQTRQRLLLNESRMLLGLIAIQERNFEEARQLMTEVLQEYSATTAQTTIPNFKGGLGLLAEQQGDLSAALVWYREAIDLARTYDELPDVAANVLGLGRVMFKMADFDIAALQYAESLRIATACGAAEVIARAHYQLATLRYSQHQAMFAESSARQALDLFRRLGMKREQAEAEALLAGLSAADA
jgi:LuxR family glucitol operon transcriptional activator